VRRPTAEQALEKVKRFRDPWGRFVPTVRAIVQASAGKLWPIDDPELRPRVLLADEDRRSLKASSATSPSLPIRLVNSCERPFSSLTMGCTPS